MKIYFKKVGIEWYVDLPDYPGSPSDLEMVMGADDFLEYLGKGDERIALNVLTEDPNDVTYIKLVESGTGSYGGRFYKAYTDPAQEMWLCPVMLYIFGHYPNELWIKRTTIV